MIEVLGSAPVSTIVSAGLNSFVSILRAKPSQAFGSERLGRSYTRTRGIIINKAFLERGPIDVNRGYQFQFNPTTIEDVKSTMYETRNYAGLPYVDYIWSGGSGRIISFELFLDNTPASHTAAFRPTEYGSSLASVPTDEKGYSYDDDGRLLHNGGKGYIGKDAVDSVIAQARSIKNGALSIKPSKNPTGFNWTEQGAYSKTRIHKRGVLPDVELLQSFLYPAPLVGEDTPKFAEGGIVSRNQFRPPATAVLCIGPLYLEGVIRQLPVTYTLFDTDLTPIRATVNVEFSVYEFVDVTRKIDHRK